jgi:hypothetical protein
MNDAVYNARGKAARVSIDVIDLTGDDEDNMTEVPAKRQPSTPRKRQSAASVTGRATKKARSSPRQFGKEILINKDSPYLVDETDHPVSEYLED